MKVLSVDDHPLARWNRFRASDAERHSSRRRSCEHKGKHRVPGEVARELAEHTGADTPTEREIEVLRCISPRCISQRRSNKLVASWQDITEQTVKTHLKSILAKLRANDGTHAVTIGTKRGFLDA